MHYIQGLCQSRLSTADYVISLVASATRQSSHLNGLMTDRE
jgi:hypothetical protein